VVDRNERVAKKGAETLIGADIIIKFRGGGKPSLEAILFFQFLILNLNVEHAYGWLNIQRSFPFGKHKVYMSS